MVKEQDLGESITLLQETIQNNEDRGIKSIDIAKETLGRSIWETPIGVSALVFGIERLLNKDVLFVPVAFSLGVVLAYSGVRDAIEGVYHLQKGFDLLKETKSLRAVLTRHIEMLK